MPLCRTPRGTSYPQPEELALEEAFRTRDAADWVADLRAAGIHVEPVAELDRTAFAAGFTEDPLNHQRGRVVTYRWGDQRPSTAPLSVQITFTPGTTR